MYSEDLQKIGLSEEQSKIYEMLLKTGFAGASKVASETRLNRTLVYKYLDELVELEMVGKIEKEGSVTIFLPLHPENIRDVLIKKRDEVTEAETSYAKIMGKMLSDFNVLDGKPGVQVFEGDEVIAVIEDTLNATTDIKEFLDVSTSNKYHSELNRKFRKRRDMKNLRRKLLVSDTKIARERAAITSSELVEWRFIDRDIDLGTVMFIYDSKISYITLTEDNERYFGVIISDPSITSLHEALFDQLWSISKKFQN